MESKTLTQEFKPLNQRLEDDEIDLFALWDTLWHRKWGIISLIIIVMMLATLIVLNITPIYRAVATLLIEQRAAKVVSIEEIYGLDGMGNEYLETQFELLKSRDLAERVVRELNLTEHPEFDPRQQPKSLIDFGSVLEDETPTEQELFDGIVVAFMERISVNPVKKTQLVKIEVDMADANMATLAANALGNAYIESQLEAKLNMTQTAASWMNERLGSLKEKLNASEYRLQEFRERENLVDIEGVTTVSAGELSQTGDRLIDARSKRAEAQSQYRQVSSLGSKEWSKLAAVPAVLSNLLVQQFKAEEAKARSKVQELSRRYGPKHPKMIGAQTELNSTTTSLKTQVEQVVASIHREYQLAAANEGSLKN